MKSSQRGVSFLGLLIVGGLLAFTGVIGAQVFPTVVENLAVEKAVNKAKEGSTVSEVRLIFDKASQVDDIKSINGKDLEISKEGDKVVVSYGYNKEIHLAGPAFLLIKYSGRSK